MPRIPYPDPKAVPAHLHELVKDRLPLNIYRMLMHAPTIMPGWMALGKGVLQEAKLSKQLRELAILRVGHLSKAAYEVHQHKKLAIVVGLSEAKIKATEVGAADPAFDEVESIVVRFTEEVVQNVKASDATFKALTRHFDHQQIVELLATIGMYMSAARLMENLEIEIEAGGGPSIEEVRKLRAGTSGATT